MFYKASETFCENESRDISMKTQLKETPRDIAIRKMKIQDSLSHSYSYSYSHSYSHAEIDSKETNSKKSRLQQIVESVSQSFLFNLVLTFDVVQGEKDL